MGKICSKSQKCAQIWRYMHKSARICISKSSYNDRSLFGTCMFCRALLMTRHYKNAYIHTVHKLLKLLFVVKIVKEDTINNYALL